MDRKTLQVIDMAREGPFFPAEFRFSWDPLLQECPFPPGGLFASVSQVGVGFGLSSNNALENGAKFPSSDLCAKYVSPEVGYRSGDSPRETTADHVMGIIEKADTRTKKKNAFKLKIKVGNPSLRRLISGAIAGAVSRTAVAPLETIRTHLMVGSCGNTSTEVLQKIISTDGYKGLFRGNFVNVIRVAPSKAIELLAFDTVNKLLSPKNEESPKLPVPASLIAGACAGVSSTLCTYPLELLKTRLTIQGDVYNNLLHCFLKIVKEEGPMELYRGLVPSLIGVIPYAATNYFTYDFLKKGYKKAAKKDQVGNVATLLIGSAAGAISSTATFPLEVARKHMQVGSLGGRQVYKNMLHALMSILEKEGIGGLYKGLGPSCVKLVPAAGISFMCYEACKRILVEKEEEDEDS